MARTWFEGITTTVVGLYLPLLSILLKVEKTYTNLLLGLVAATESCARHHGLNVGKFRSIYNQQQFVFV